jgi:hypothetical protein
MQSGVTSPARPWKRLTTPDLELTTDWEVRNWLDIVNKRMDAVFLRSNLYNSLPIIYGDMSVFGTAAMYVEEDLDTVIHTKVFPIGSYCVSTNSKGKVDTFCRLFRMTIRQVIEEFTDGKDLSNLSEWIKSQWQNGYGEAWVDIVHVIHPNTYFYQDAFEAKFLPYRSVYYEAGSGQGATGSYMDPSSDQRLLRESGYELFPVLCPRWQVNAEDAYGTDCPGMSALADVKSLQKMQRRGLQAVEKMVMPAMTGPSSLRRSRVSLLPGDLTYSDEREGQRGLRAIHDVSLRLAELHQYKQDARELIQRAFYEDLFLLLARSDRPQMTAREVAERHEEKLLALGEVLEQINQDLLDPLIDVTFSYMLRQGLIPEPPEQLEGTKLRVQYESIMAQAQKLVSVSGLERFGAWVDQRAAVDATVLDKVDSDNLTDAMADALSVPTNILRDQGDVDQIRAAREAQAQADAMAARAHTMSTATKDLSQAKLEDDNALGRLLDQAEAGQAVPVA